MCHQGASLICLAQDLTILYAAPATEPGTISSYPCHPVPSSVPPSQMVSISYICQLQIIGTEMFPYTTKSRSSTEPKRNSVQWLPKLVKWLECVTGHSPESSADVTVAPLYNFMVWYLRTGTSPLQNHHWNPSPTMIHKLNVYTSAVLSCTSSSCKVYSSIACVVWCTIIFTCQNNSRLFK